MNKRMLIPALIASLVLLNTSTVRADGQAIDRYYDNRGDRIEHRLDHKGHRAQQYVNRRAKR